MDAAENRLRCPSSDELSVCLAQCGDIAPELQRHLARCDTCRNTLRALAGEEDWWNDAAKFLSADIEPAAKRISHSVCAMSSEGEHTSQRSLLEHELAQFQQLLQPASHPELLGRLGRYELEELVGRGGMGLVFRGHDTELHRVVAVKTIAAHLSPQGAARERFIREARASASLTHPHIVAVYDVVTEGSLPAIVMQYVAGPTLQQWLSEHGRLAWGDVLQIGIQLADALATAHEHGLVHRDIKPGNVMLEAGATRALLTDFGLVRALNDATLTHTGTLAGTPEFMSPEQALGRPVDGRSDLFSLGCLLYAMLSGHPPFRAPEPLAVLNRLCHERHRSLIQIERDVPIELSRVVDRLLAKQPRKRFASAVDLRSRLHQLAKSPVHLSGRRRRPRLLTTAAAALVVLLAGAGLAVWLRSDTEHSAEFDGPLAASPTAVDPGQDRTTTAAARSTTTAAGGDFIDLQKLDRQIGQLRHDVGRLEQFSAPTPLEIKSDEAPATDDFDRHIEQLKQSLRRVEQDH